MLPNLICPGAQKSGTTTLFALLRQHPSVFIPDAKETKFFCDDEKWVRGRDSYERLFAGASPNHRYICDMTPEYMYFPHVAERIAQTLGEDVRFIFMLRNPVDRAYSHYWMSVRRGYEKSSFEDALRLEEKRIQNGAFEMNHFSYATRGFYARQIHRFLDRFERDNMIFVLFEEFTSDQSAAMRQIFRWLRIDPGVEVAAEVQRNRARLPRSRWLKDVIESPPVQLSNVLRVLIPSERLRGKMKRGARELNYAPFEKPRLPRDLHARLVSIFEEDVAELEGLIGRDLSAWRAIPGDGTEIE
jgi:hypothetical protein